MKIGRFLLGIFFLAGPNISIYDLFPDIIGYLLIASSIKKTAVISQGVDLARDGLKKLKIIAISKIVAGFLLFYMSASSQGSFDRGWHLTFAFAFAIIELIYTVPAFNTLLEGLDSAWVRYGPGKGDKEYSNTLAFTRFFIIVKSAFNVLSELPFLMESSAIGSTSDIEYVTAQSMRTVLSLLNVVCVFALGMVWLYRMSRYMRRFKYASFQQNARNEYLRILKDDPSLMLRARLSNVYSLLKAGVLFTFSFTVWNINTIPSFAFGLILLVVYELMSRVIKGTDGVKVLSVGRTPRLYALLFTVASLIQYALTLFFLSRFGAGDGSLSYADIISVVIEKEQGGLALFIAVVTFTVLEAITLTLSVWQLCKVMYEAAKVYTPTKYEREQTRHKNDEVLSAIKKAFNLAFISSVILAVSSVAQQALLFTASIMWFVTMLASVLFIVLFLRAVDVLMTETENRFKYE